MASAKLSVEKVVDEKTTRKLLIDRALKGAGWSPIIRYFQGASYDTAAVEEYQTAEGPADYVLFHRGEEWDACTAERTVELEVELASRKYGDALKIHHEMVEYLPCSDGISSTWWSNPLMTSRWC